MKMMIHKYVVNHEDIVSEVQLNPSMTGHPHRDEWKRKWVDIQSDSDDN